MVKVILQQNIEGLGNKGSIIKVKDGFARNYLLPRGLALSETEGNLKVVERKLKFEEKCLGEHKSKAEELAKRIAAISCTVSVDTHDNDEVYGSVSVSSIVAALEAEGISLDKKQVLLEEPIKSLGIYEIPIKLHPEVCSKVKVWVVKK